MFNVDFPFNGTEFDYNFLSKLLKLLTITVFGLVLLTINFYLVLFIYLFCNLNILSGTFKKLLIYF